MTTNPQMQISTTVGNIPQALSIYFNQLVYDQKRKGRDMTTLSLGEAFFDIPMFDFNKIDFVKGYHYSESQGVPELRQKIADFYLSEYKAKIDPTTELLITAGSKPAILFCFLATLNPGDEVLIHEPAWLSYQEQVRMAKGKVTFIPFNEEINSFHKHFKPNSKMLVLNNPNNPAGRLYTKEELLSLYKQCRERGIYIMVDEAYSDFVINEPFHSMAGLVPDKDGVIVVNSLSKNMGMSGWRIGYIITSKDLIPQLLKVNQHVITCAPTVLQLYMAKYFDKITSCTLPQVREVVYKRERIAKFVDEMGLKRLKGNCTFYFFISLEDFQDTSMDFCLHLLLFHGISVVPGTAYGKSTDHFIRMSIGTESEERIHDAVLTIKNTIAQKKVDTKVLYEKLRKEGFEPFKAPNHD